MSKSLVDELFEDVHVRHGLEACINCGMCTSVCPAALVYDYDPRVLVNLVEKRDEQTIEELLKSDYIWYCGECMSCTTRCPRNNSPGEIVIALRHLSQRKGLFIHSARGRQQYAVLKTVGGSILGKGYCVYFDDLTLERFPEQGPTWDWVRKNRHQILNKVGAAYKEVKAGPMRKIAESDLAELKKIFDVTGGSELYEIIEEKSREVMKKEGKDEESYFNEVYESPVK